MKPSDILLETVADLVKQNDVFYNPRYNEFKVISLLNTIVYTNKYQLALARHNSDDFLPLFLMYIL